MKPLQAGTLIPFKTRINYLHELSVDFLLTYHDHVVLFRPRRGEGSACAAASAALVVAVAAAAAAATVATVFIIVVAAVVAAAAAVLTVAAGALFPGATSYFQSCLFLLYVLVKPHLAVELEIA